MTSKDPHPNRSKTPSRLAHRAKPVTIGFASLLTVACTTQQKVDRVHASIYHQEASIQQLESDLRDIEVQRGKILSDLDTIQVENDENADQIRQASDKLTALSDQQTALNNKMRNVNASVYSNTRSLSDIQSDEEKRMAIIKEQQEKWQQITQHTDRKLSELEPPKVATDLEAKESTSNNEQP
jgi:predicted  nucleic acid-binding Zn-ribbon protein